MQHKLALPKSVATVLDAFNSLGESFKGAITVDAEARISWIDDRYRELLGLSVEAEIVGQPVEQVIPHSLLRRVVETGRPILIDIMAFDDKQFVVCRLPLRNEDGEIQGLSVSSSTRKSTIWRRSSKIRGDAAPAQSRTGGPDPRTANQILVVEFCWDFRDRARAQDRGAPLCPA